MVDVSVEALQTVKDALTTFQTDIEGLSVRSANNADSVLADCKAHIGKTQVEGKISDLTKQISDLEARISRATNEYNALLSRIPQIENNIHSFNSMISSLNTQVASLRAQLANVEDDDLRQQIQAQINKLSRQVSQCEAERNQVEDELSRAEQKKTELQQTIGSAKSQKAECENELSVQKNRCNKLKDKLERLNTAFSRVEADLSAYVAVTKKFESSSSDKVQGNASAVEKCMASIEEYLSISL